MPRSRSNVDGTRSATMTVPRWAPTASSEAREDGHLGDEVLDALEFEGARPARTDLDPWVADRQPATLERRVRRDPDVEVRLGDAHRRHRGLGHERLGEGGQAGAGARLGQAARARGGPATCSARPATRRPSTRSNVASDCASETPATAKRTTTMIASWRAKSWPASVGRRLRSLTTMNSTFSADRSATAAPPRTSRS